MKKRKEFLLPEDVLQYIEDYRKKNYIKTQTEAFCKIVGDHKEKNDNEVAKVILQFLSEEITEKLMIAMEETYQLKNTLTRIRLGTNNADRNSDVILLLINTMLAFSGHLALQEEDVLPTSEAKRVVNERIAAYRTKAAERKGD